MFARLHIGELTRKMKLHSSYLENKYLKTADTHDYVI